MSKPMTAERKREEQEIHFFYNHNYTIMIGGAILVLACCLFWVCYNFLTDDSMFFVSTGAIWSILLMIAASVAVIFIGRNLKEIEMKGSKEIHIWSWTCMCYFGFLFLMVSMVTVAGIAASVAAGGGKSLLYINLVSALLFFPVIAPMPQKRCGYILGVQLFGFAFLPYAMPIAEYYSVLQELVLRVSLIVAYIVIWRRIRNAFEMDREMKELNRELEKTSDEVIDMLVNAVEVRDTESGEHVKRVRYFSRLLAEDVMIEYPEFDLSPEQVDIITRASGMHDIGKIMIPDSILLKPGKLTEEEWEVMKTHSEKGFELLKEAPKAWGEDLIRISKEICLYHHEKYDGAGYPGGLAGEEIPIWAQIVSLADCYEALTSDRTYKKACSPETACNMIMNGQCGAFSNEMLQSLTRVKDQFAQMVIRK